VIAGAKWRREKLEALSEAALARLGKIIETGADKDALAASDMVLRRTMPEPKATALDIARAAAIGAGAGAGGLGAIAAKAQARLASVDITDSVETTFTPVCTLEKGAKG
jgi:hypothetical protein